MSDRPLHEVLTEGDHPDPEGHLTDLTISALRDLRDDLMGAPAPTSTFIAGERTAEVRVARLLDAILEPWGESTD